MRSTFISLLIFFTAPLMMKAQDSLPDIQKLTGLPLEELMNMSVVSSAGSSQKNN